LENFKGWDFCDWEAFAKNQKGHAELIRQLKKIVREKYGLKILKFDKKEAYIAARYRLVKPTYYTYHEPDLIITDSERLEDRIFIEYVNTPGKNMKNFLRDLRGMLALSSVIKNSRGFVLAIRESLFRKYMFELPRDSPVEIMSIKSLLYALDIGDLDYLVGRTT